MVAVRMFQDDVIEDHLRPELPAQMSDDFLARLRVATVDEHQSEIVRLAVANDDGVTGLRGGPDRQELDLAFEKTDHLDLPRARKVVGILTTSATVWR